MNILLIVLLVLLLVLFFSGAIVITPYLFVAILVGVAAAIYISRNV